MVPLVKSAPSSAPPSMQVLVRVQGSVRVSGMAVRPTEIRQQASEQQQSMATLVLVLPLLVQARPAALLARECSNLIRPLALPVQQEPEQQQVLELELELELEQDLVLVPRLVLLGRSANLALADSVPEKMWLGQIELPEKPNPKLKWARLAVSDSKAQRRE